LDARFTVIPLEHCLAGTAPNHSGWRFLRFLYPSPCALQLSVAISWVLRHLLASLVIRAIHLRPRCLALVLPMPSRPWPRPRWAASTAPSWR